MDELTRLETIEIKLAHLERSLQELGQAVMRAQRDIDTLSAHNRALKAHIDAIEGAGASPTAFEKPPHY